MAVFLLIVKIIGILLASIVGLVLLLLALILFVPFRYKLYGQKHDDLYLMAKVTWLLHIVSFKFEYTGEGKPVSKARVFGIPVYNSTKPKKDQDSEKEQKAENHQEDKKDTEEGKRELTEYREGISKETAVELEHETDIRFDSDEETEEDTEKGSDQYHDEPEHLPEVNRTNSYEHQEQETDTDAVKKAEKAPEIKKLDMRLPVSDTSTYDSEKDADTSGFTKRYEKVKRKIIQIAEKIKNSILAPIRFIKKTILQIQILKEFLENEVNQEGIKVALRSIGKLLKHLGPRKASGLLAFGTGDPATTGYVLAALGMFYGKIGKNFSIQPNFEESMLYGNIKITGRFYIITITVIALRLWFNKNFKKLRENFDKFKKDMKQPVSV